jgi:S-adenosylmethionine:tRNA ribosyltransferase-isomerase
VIAAADRRDRPSAKLLALEASGTVRHHARADLASIFEAGDVVVANDAATLPASLSGVHAETGASVEIRLAAWVTGGDPTRFAAIAFGAGDHRTPTERRTPPPRFHRGDHLVLGPLTAFVERVADHPRLLERRFLGSRETVVAGIARHGRPIQYAHVPAPLALWDVWTNVAADPVAFESPSAGFALDWRTLGAWRQRGIEFATLTHAAGISSTGDASLDRRLPFDEPYVIPERTANLVRRAKAFGRRVVAIGTTVVRALEDSARDDGLVHAGEGIARNRIGSETRLRVVDAVLTGIHQPGESHYELLRAFVEDQTLLRVSAIADEAGYRGHEFGDSMLVERGGARRERSR